MIRFFVGLGLLVAVGLTLMVGPATAGEYDPCQRVLAGAENGICEEPGPFGEGDRVGYCIDGRYFDLLFGQPYVDPAFAGAVIHPALMRADGATHCDYPLGFLNTDDRGVPLTWAGPLDLFV